MESCDVISTSEIQNSAKMELSEFNLLAKCSTKGQDDHCTSEHVLKNTKKNFLDEKSYSLNSELNQNNKKNNNDDCFCRIEECKAQKVFHLHSSNENNLDLIPSATNYINANVIDMAPNLCENSKCNECKVVNV